MTVVELFNQIAELVGSAYQPRLPQEWHRGRPACQRECLVTEHEDGTYSFNLKAHNFSRGVSNMPADEVLPADGE